MQRVLLITDRYLPEVGGTITWFDNMYRRYRPGSVWIATQDYSGARDFDRRYVGITLYRASLKRYRFLKPESLLLYVKLFAMGAWVALRWRINVIHVGKVLPEGLVARLIGKMFRIPYVVYAHGEDVTIFGNNPAYRRALSLVYNDAGAVIANSAFTAEELVRRGVSAEKIARISPGVDPEMFKPESPDDALVDELGVRGKLVVLSVGRLTKRKGHDHVIRALPEILARWPEVAYVILSTGEERESLEALARELGVEGAVTFVGEVPYERLPKYYNCADLFVMANRTLPGGDVEGFGIVFLEANACGKPVIAGDSGGTGDPVKKRWNGFRIDATPENIAAAVLELAESPALRESMGRNGRALVESEYAWDRIYERIRDLSESVAHGSSPGKGAVKPRETKSNPCRD